MVKYILLYQNALQIKQYTKCALASRKKPASSCVRGPTEFQYFAVIV